MIEGIQYTRFPCETTCAGILGIRKENVYIPYFSPFFVRMLRPRKKIVSDIGGRSTICKCAFVKTSHMLAYTIYIICIMYMGTYKDISIMIFVLFVWRLDSIHSLYILHRHVSLDPCLDCFCSTL